MPELYIGLMSGTSLDGVDAALVDYSQAAQTLVATHFAPYPDTLRAEVLALNSAGADEIHRAALVANTVAELYAKASVQLMQNAGVSAEAVRALGAHGQTIRHRPELGFTVQLCNAALLAERTGITVISDFRSRDIAAGGQGAPLVPAFHAASFKSNRHRLILNIGGIANLTDLPSDAPVKGFDTGPGNLLIDAWCAKHTGQSFDRDGAWASKGKIIGELLDRMLDEAFFNAAPPKSTGRDLFNEQWLAQYDLVGHPPVDVQATLLELTARSIAHAAASYCAGATEMYVCGGGASNGALMGRIRANTPHLKVQSTEVLGLHPDWVEAVAFAWLAHQTMNGIAGNLAEVTGAVGARVLGAIYPK